MTEWYVRTHTQRFGPVSEAQLRAMAETSQLGEGALLWQPGRDEWLPADQVLGAAPSTTSTATPLPASSTEISSPVLGSSSDSNTNSTSNATEVLGIVAEPWHRFFARAIDIYVWSFVLAVAVGLFWPALVVGNTFTGPLGSRLLGWILLPFAMILDALCFALLGNTLGKWIAGIKVKTVTGEKASFLTYLKRNFGMYIFGLGTGFPIVSFFTEVSSFSRADKEEVMRWDESTQTRPFVKSHSTVRLVVVGAIWVLLRGLDIWSQTL